MKAFCLHLADFNDKYKLDDEVWDNIDKILPVFQMFSEKMKHLQRENLTMVEAYGQWMDLTLRVQQLPKNEFIEKVDYFLGERKKMIYNEVMLSALFLDLRFQLLLNNNEKDIAIEHLRKLCIKMKLSTNVNDESSGQRELNSTSANSISAFAEYLNQIEIETACNSQLKTINDEIDSFGRLARFDMNVSIDHIWSRHHANHPILYQLFKIISSVPPTEVTIERNFSKLKHCITRLRCRLTNEEVERIMFLALNDSFFK